MICKHNINNQYKRSSGRHRTSSDALWLSRTTVVVAIKRWRGIRGTPLLKLCRRFWWKKDEIDGRWENKTPEIVWIGWPSSIWPKKIIIICRSNKVRVGLYANEGCIYVSDGVITESFLHMYWIVLKKRRTVQLLEAIEKEFILQEAKGVTRLDDLKRLWKGWSKKLYKIVLEESQSAYTLDVS